MGGLPAMHVNTTLTILISALYADARFWKAVTRSHLPVGVRRLHSVAYDQTAI
jgi:hypothetical protein